jgi:predicted MPP superfamily phosphohydrolase
MIIIAFLLVVIITFFIYRAFNNTKDIMVNAITLNNNKNLFKKKLNILHLSDIHLENISVSPEELFRLVNHQQIDLIVLTGDFLDKKRSIPKLTQYMSILQSIKSTYGMYAVFGNHDYMLKGTNFEQLKTVLKQYGCHTLQNENVTIDVDGERLNIIGIDDYSTNRSNLSDSYQGVQDGYNLVITHDPNVVLEMEHYHYNYLLSGHFHGGQICWPKPYHLVKMGKLVRLNMIKGLHYHNGKPFYISEGLGQSGVNIRVGSRPEITFHEV